MEILNKADLLSNLSDQIKYDIGDKVIYLASGFKYIYHIERIRLVSDMVNSCVNIHYDINDDTSTIMQVSQSKLREYSEEKERIIKAFYNI